MALMMTARLAALLDRMAISVALMALITRVDLAKKPSRLVDPALWTVSAVVGSGTWMQMITAAGVDHPVHRRVVGNSRCEGPGRLRHRFSMAWKELMVIAEWLAMKSRQARKPSAPAGQASWTV